MCLLMGDGMACGSLPFLGTGCPIPDVDNLCLICINFYVWDAVSILTCSLGCFDHGFCFSNNGLNMLPWTSFTCYTKGNQQGCFRLSNWFSLRRLGPWMTHLPPAWWSTFRLTFQNDSWYVSLEWYFIYLLFIASVHGFMHETSDFLTL